MQGLEQHFMILNSYKAVFVHIPRTGGTSIEASFACLDCDRQKHLLACEIPLLPEKYFKFCFVRNPWDRILSYYRWRLMPQAIWVPAAEKQKAQESFKAWLHYTKDRRNNAQSLDLSNIVEKNFLCAILPQYESITIADRLLVDFIGRYENLQADYDKICDTISAPRQRLRHFLPSQTQGRSEHYSHFYDKETINFVGDLYKKDIEFFGYSF